MTGCAELLMTAVSGGFAASYPQLQHTFLALLWTRCIPPLVTHPRTLSYMSHVNVLTLLSPAAAPPPLVPVAPGDALQPL